MELTCLWHKPYPWPTNAVCRPRAFSVTNNHNQIVGGHSLWPCVMECRAPALFCPEGVTAPHAAHCDPELVLGVRNSLIAMYRGLSEGTPVPLPFEAVCLAL